ncbi:MAG TPA: PRC-barrel domain-containing protein [Arenibaculum sp.]|nr:PRC-barrel domain-containing protein [Arenibaculum sp.]
MRRYLPLAAATMILAVTAAVAQTPADTPEAAAGDPMTAPLNTRPQPDDRATTDAIPVTPGVDGDAPSSELTEMGAPVGPGTPGTGRVPTDAPANLTPEGARQGPAGDTPVPPEPEPELPLRRAESLVGRPAMDASGEPVGTVRDFVLNETGGRVDHVVIGFDDTGRERLVALPADRIEGTEQEELHLHATADEVADAPDFGYGPGIDTLVGPR